MERIVHSLVQGTPPWDEFRLTRFGASEIAAVLGLSKTTTRAELLRAKKTGIAKEFSDFLQRNVLDRGHEIEALARPLAVEFSGVDGFYPATYSLGRLSASTDGVDMLDETAWECKSLNGQNGPLVRAGQVPEEHMPQCQQVLMVTGADRLLFTVSDGTRENTFHVWVEPDTAWFDRIRAAWAQFAIDLETYEPTEPVIEAVGRTPETLPALRIEVTGAVTASNLAQYRDHALAVFAGINRDLKTDQDFANADKTVKWCAEVESRLAAAKQHALSQTESIDVLFKTIDDITAEARSTRLELDKLVKARKEARRGEIVAAGVGALRKHIDDLNARLGNAYMPAATADFGGVIKGLRSFDSMQNAVDTALANAKIAASATADRISANLAHLAAEASEYGALFPDVATIVLKQPDDFAALVQFRVADHKAREQKRADELSEQSRERIRQEEAARIQREQDEENRRAAAATAAAPAPVAAPIAAPAVTPAATPAVLAMTPRAAAAPAARPTLSLGQIKDRVAPLSITAEGLATLGFAGLKERGSVLYHEADFGHILAAMTDHLQAIHAKQAA